MKAPLSKRFRNYLGIIFLTSYVLVGYFVLAPKTDPARAGFRISHGMGELSWDPIREKLNVFQESETIILEMTRMEIPAIVHRSNVPNPKIVLRVENGNPMTIFGKLKTSGSVNIICKNGILVSGGGVIDVPGTVTFSTLDIDNIDFLNGGRNRLNVPFAPPLLEVGNDAVISTSMLSENPIPASTAAPAMLGNRYALAIEKDGSVRAVETPRLQSKETSE